MSKQDTTNQRQERTPNNRTTTGYRISDELWAVLQPLLPVHVNTHRFGGGLAARARSTLCGRDLLHPANRLPMAGA
jgi:hypothetical protein